MFVGYFTFGWVHSYYAMDATPIYQVIHLPKTNKIGRYLIIYHLCLCKSDFKNIYIMLIGEKKNHMASIHKRKYLKKIWPCVVHHGTNL